ncbi:MAG: branched-chain amino acid aminotransferase [Planctomycetes bacterium]|nr:branched-chain amino acid aminotransferase [Planctomycetota bacterium]
MLQLLKRLARDEAGFVVSAELVLIATILTLSMIVGLTKISYAVHGELNDIASAFDAHNYDPRYDSHDPYASHDSDPEPEAGYGDFGGY